METSELAIRASERERCAAAVDSLARYLRSFAATHPSPDKLGQALALYADVANMLRTMGPAREDRPHA